MSLLDPISALQKATPLALGPVRWYFGEVVFNADQLQVGRIKVKIPNLLDFSGPDQYPYVYPLHDFGLRGPHPGTMLRIPVLGSHVMVCFPHNQIYFGFYHAA